MDLETQPMRTWYVMQLPYQQKHEHTKLKKSLPQKEQRYY